MIILLVVVVIVDVLDKRRIVGVEEQGLTLYYIRYSEVEGLLVTLIHAQCTGSRMIWRSKRPASLKYSYGYDLCFFPDMWADFSAGLTGKYAVLLVLRPLVMLYHDGGGNMYPGEER